MHHCTAFFISVIIAVWVVTGIANIHDCKGSISRAHLFVLQVCSELLSPTMVASEVGPLVSDNQIGSDSIIQNTTSLGEGEFKGNTGFDVATWLDLQTIGVGQDIIASNARRTQVE